MNINELKNRLFRWWGFLKIKRRLKRQRYVIGGDVSGRRGYGDDRDRIMVYAFLKEAYASAPIWDKRIRGQEDKGAANSGEGGVIRTH